MLNVWLIEYQLFKEVFSKPAVMLFPDNTLEKRALRQFLTAGDKSNRFKGKMQQLLLSFCVADGPPADAGT